MLDNREAIQPIQQAVLQWCNSYDLPTQMMNIQEIVDGELILTILETVPHFNLLHPQEQTPEMTFVYRINRIKNIGKSILRYYQTILLRDVSSMKLNYVQMCMGSKEDIFKLILLVVGIILRNQHPKQQLESKLKVMEAGRRKLFNILIENALMIGEGAGESPRMEKNEGKKLIDRVETLQEEVQILERQNQDIEAQLRAQRQTNKKLLYRIDELQKHSKEIIKKLQLLQNANQKLEHQLNCKRINEEQLISTLNSTKTILTDRISHISEERDKLQSEIQSLEKKLSKFHQIYEIDASLKEINESMKKQIESLGETEGRLKEEIKQQRMRYLNLFRENQNLLIQVNELKLKESLSKLTNNKQRDFESDESDVEEYNCYDNAMKDSLSVLKFNQSVRIDSSNYQVQQHSNKQKQINDQYKDKDENINNLHRIMRISDLNDDKLVYSAITNSQDHNNKENINSFNKTINSNQKIIKNKEFSSFQDIQEEQSFQMEDTSKISNLFSIKKKYNDEISYLSSIILSLKKQIEKYKSDIQKYIKREEERQQRKDKYAQIVNKMFQ